MKNRSKLFVLVCALLVALFSFAVYAQESIAVDLQSVTNMRNIEGTKSENEIVLSSINGVNENRESPALFFKEVEVDTSVYRYLVMEMKTDITLGEGGFASHASVGTGFSESKRLLST